MPKSTTWKKDRKIILFVEAAPDEAIQQLRDYIKEKKKDWVLGLTLNSKKRHKEEKLQEWSERFDVIIKLDYESDRNMLKRLKPYEDQLLAVTCRSEASMMKFKRLIPNIPYLRTPIPETLDWATDKTQMRRRFRAYDKDITPKYKIVSDMTTETIEKIHDSISFPLVVKPSGLAQSLLVSICYHEEEMLTALRKNFRAIRKHFKERGITEKPKVMVEEFMEGDMYSIDSYVNSRGKVQHCPPVAVTTGRNIGFDDFFNYFQITPTQLTKKSIKDLEEITEKGIHALGLKNTSAHSELIRTEQGWKLVEIGARVGGFRQKFYEMSYGIQHAVNDVLVHIPEKIKIPKKKKGYSAVMKIYAKKEGRLEKILGLKKIQNLDSIESITTNRNPGDRCTFSKNGGKSVINIILFNKSRSKLLADKRRIEQSIDIRIEKKK